MRNIWGRLPAKDGWTLWPHAAALIASFLLNLVSLLHLLVSSTGTIPLVPEPLYGPVGAPDSPFLQCNWNSGHFPVISPLRRWHHRRCWLILWKIKADLRSTADWKPLLPLFMCPLSAGWINYPTFHPLLSPASIAPPLIRLSSVAPTASIWGCLFPLWRLPLQINREMIHGPHPSGWRQDPDPLQKMLHITSNKRQQRQWRTPRRSRSSLKALQPLRDIADLRCGSGDVQRIRFLLKQPFKKEQIWSRWGEMSPSRCLFCQLADRRFWFGFLPGPGTGFLPQNIRLWTETRPAFPPVTLWPWSLIWSGVGLNVKTLLDIKLKHWAKSSSNVANVWKPTI